jgi:hypothetical protein
MVGLLLLALAMGNQDSPNAAESAARITRVRSSDSRLTDVIAEATRRSETFRRLVARIGDSNGIVYVESGKCTHGVRACLQMWVQASGSDRFLRIVIDTKRTDSFIELAASLGHELQHAIEGLTEPAVTTGPKLFNYFKRYAPTDNNRFETVAAVNAGNATADELQETVSRHRVK